MGTFRRPVRALLGAALATALGLLLVGPPTAIVLAMSDGQLPSLREVVELSVLIALYAGILAGPFVLVAGVALWLALERSRPLGPSGAAIAAGAVGALVALVFIWQLAPIGIAAGAAAGLLARSAVDRVAPA